MDIDLSILGAAEARFAQYERQIREEYGFVPETLFRSKRGAILRTFLDRGRLFGTPALRDRFEARARVNLAAALAALSTSA